MTVLHLLTPAVHPEPGGLEDAVLRIARGFASKSEHEVVIYTRRQAAAYSGPDPLHAGLEVVHLAGPRSFLLEPLHAEASPLSENTPTAYLLEAYRADFLLLRNAIAAGVERRPDARHVVVSFFISSAGFVAQQAATNLRLPHIASVRGSDFERDVRSPFHFAGLRFVVENADLVVTTNREQAEALAAMFPSARALQTIHNGLPEDELGPLWEAPASETIRLAADCGFSVKKATHLLLRSVGVLLEAGEPISLTVAGADAPKEKEYWEERRRHYVARFPNAFSFPGWLAPREIGALFRASHIYCSASLGEGCSQSHTRALTAGMPAVATRTGALPELAGDCPHVRLAAPGDVEGFTRQLRAMVSAVRAGSVLVDRDQVLAWRRHFSPERECAEWAKAAATVTR
ncbi:MAG: glycosyltransferase family 4 protein [Bryobacteraceae bacterium]|nr:glycosyltransferase family 4 protein [Bryobacteraceae bacterium]